MFKRIKISNNFKCSGNLRFQNFSVLENILKKKSFKGTNYNCSSVLGKNNSVLLKESPFHYPIAKKVLNNTTKNISIISNFTVNVPFIKKKIKYSSLLKLVEKNSDNMNSLYTPKSTLVSLYIDYTPKI